MRIDRLNYLLAYIISPLSMFMIVLTIFYKNITKKSIQYIENNTKSLKIIYKNNNLTIFNEQSYILNNVNSFNNLFFFVFF